MAHSSLDYSSSLSSSFPFRHSYRADYGQRVFFSRPSFPIVFLVALFSVIELSPSSLLLAQRCEYTGDKDTCYLYMANNTLPCYCLSNNWFYRWECCFASPPVNGSMYQCWCGSYPTTAGIVVVSVILSVAFLSFIVALFMLWMGRKVPRSSTDLLEDSVIMTPNSDEVTVNSDTVHED